MPMVMRSFTAGLVRHCSRVSKSGIKLKNVNSPLWRLTIQTCSGCASAPPASERQKKENERIELEAEVRSNVPEYEPLVTPRGKPARLGVVVATPAFWKNGAVVGPWIWEAVVVPSKPLKFTCSARV